MSIRHQCMFPILKNDECTMFIVSPFFQGCEKDTIMSTSSGGSGAGLLTFKKEGSGLCSAVQDFCCKPKVENQPPQSPAIPETPKPTPEPSKPKCNDIPGFQCLTNINVSDHYQTILKVSYQPHVISF